MSSIPYGNLRLLFALAISSIWHSTLLGAEIETGPMIGAMTTFETTIWLQTTEPATVRIRYWPEDAPEKAFLTSPVTTSASEAHIARCLADKLEPGTAYQYEVLIDETPHIPVFRDGYEVKGSIPLGFKTPDHWRFREGGHLPWDFSFAFGSCYYRNDPDRRADRLNGPPYGGKYDIFESIYEKSPDFFIWLGDNVYTRDDDWTSRTGYVYRWTHQRALPELRPLLATTPQYFIWDDHDFGPNDIGGAFWNKALATDVFKQFTANPSYGLPELPGIFTFFNWGDVNFYLLDNRTYRTSSALKSTGSKPRQTHGKAQIDWLLETLTWASDQAKPGKSYPVNFHVVCTGDPVLSPFPGDALCAYSEEWEYLFDRLLEEEIGNVIFLTGDLHFSEVNKRTLVKNSPTEPSKAFTFYDITTSPLTSGSWEGPDAKDVPFRLDIFPGEMDRIGDRNFAQMFVKGPPDNRRIELHYYDHEGNLLNQKPGTTEGTVTDASVIYAADLAPR